MGYAVCTTGRRLGARRMATHTSAHWALSILMAYKAVLSRTVVRVQMTFELGSVVAPTWVHTRNQCHYQQTSQHFDRYLMSW